jgi:outer membrane receptor protein involved in Fe transport
VVGGLRVERWTAAIDITSEAAIDTVTPRLETDPLWSVNVTYRLSGSTNIRGAAYRTIVKPDLRELSPGGYAPALGGLLQIGNPDLQRGTVFNADLRLETYPAAGELIAVSAFAKTFHDPIVTTRILQGEFVERPDNATRAISRGVELEGRKNLGSVDSWAHAFQAALNLALIHSRVTLPERLGDFDPDLTFQGQSPYLLNVGLLFDTRTVSASVLYNRVGDRVVRYGGQAGTGSPQGPSSVELEHGTLDAKVRYLWGRSAFTLSGRNLTNPIIEVRDDKAVEGSTEPVLQESTRLGYTIDFGVSYGF